jgi:hypothetical protein
MSDPTDREEAAPPAGTADSLVCVEGLVVGDPPLDAGDAEARIHGNMAPATRASSRRSVRVDGSLLGTREQPCVVAAGGEIVIEGDVCHAILSGDAVRIQGSARHCHVTAYRAAEVGGDLGPATLAVGGFESRLQDLARCRQEAMEAAHEHRLLQTRLGVEERRLARLLKVTRLVCEVALGQLIRPGNERLQVNLEAFYRVIGARPREQMEAALLDFFTRAVIGRLAHTNQSYLRSNPNNQKVFLRVLADLRQLFVLTFQLDNAAWRQQRAVATAAATTETIARNRPCLAVGGAIGPGLRLQFIVAESTGETEDSPAFVARSGRLQLEEGAPGELTCRQTDPGGKESVTREDLGHWRGLRLWCTARRVVRRPLAAHTDTAAEAAGLLPGALTEPRPASGAAGVDAGT